MRYKSKLALHYIMRLYPEIVNNKIKKWPNALRSRVRYGPGGVERSDIFAERLPALRPYFLLLLEWHQFWREQSKRCELILERAELEGRKDLGIRTEYRHVGRLELNAGNMFHGFPDGYEMPDPELKQWLDENKHRIPKESVDLIRKRGILD